MIVIILISLVLCAWLGLSIGEMGGKNNGTLGLVLGFFLGPIGILIVAGLPANPDPTVLPPKPPQTDLEKAQIALLKAQTEAVQRQAMAAARQAVVKPAARGKDLADDGGIPTYKLD